MQTVDLKAGDKIALVCTGTTCTQQEIMATSKYLKQRYGLEPQVHANTHLPQTAATRAAWLRGYLLDDDIKLIWSLRGGEGSADILPWLHDDAALIQQAKMKGLIGFSDFTPLLVYFSQHHGWPVIHGPGARQLSHGWIDAASEQSTLDWMFRHQHQILLDDLNWLNAGARGGQQTLSAQLIGGNLSLIDISIKDIWEFDTANKIVFLEEVNEKPYRVARLLKYLHRLNFFSQAAAVLLCGFYFAEEGEQASLHQQYNASLDKVFTRFAASCSCPVLLTQQVSHGKQNRPLPFNATATLTLGDAPSLLLQRDA